ncbi:MAG: arylsulfatase [Bryobacteraceae bacterium]
MDRRQFLATATVAGTHLARAADRKRPNILLILADDLGFSDPGCFGGEIETPNIDRLARGGVRFTQFYNTARCCPSRASLMTGLYPHQTGVGNMIGGPPKMQNPPGYRGAMNDRCTTIPAVLRDAGYATLMAGKWHLGQPGPTERGFDEFFGMVHGFDSFWDASKYTRLPKGRPASTYREGEFYATDAITDHAIEFIGGARKSSKPFFTYLAYNAPHFPLHAPKDLIDKYQPVYEKGWDAIREARFARLREMGLIDKRWDFTPRSVIPPNRVATPHGWAGKPNPAWETVEPDRRTDMARRMATYAAMVDRMDQNIGRVLADLESDNELDNTLILFFSDNGACAEWDPWGFDVRSGPDNVLHRGAELAKMGQPGTYHSYGSAWANACGTPWRLYKHYNHEGGITTPFIAHWPSELNRRGKIEHQPGHLVDVMPTFLDAAGARYPAGGAVPPAEGVSLLPAMRGRRLPARQIYWEHEGNRAVRDGKWKIAAVGPTGPWELYDMERDRTEMHDLAARNPKRVQAMASQWEGWAKRTGALPWIW